MTKNFATLVLAMTSLVIVTGCANRNILPNSDIFLKVNQVEYRFTRFNNAVNGQAAFVSQDKRLYDRFEVRSIIENTKNFDCRLTNEKELIILMQKMVLSEKPSQNQFYWLESVNSKSHNYALYFHISTNKIMDFGNLVFPAHLCLICN